MERLFIADKIMQILFCMVVICGCQSTSSQHPNLLTQEIQLFDSLRNVEPWDTITRYINNIESNGNVVLDGKLISWEQPYEYAIIFDTRDIAYFNLVDTTYVHKLSSIVYAQLPSKHLKTMIIFFRYICPMVDREQSMVIQKSYRVCKKAENFIIFDLQKDKDES